MSTPRADGFAMPAEWAPHRRCWMAWPCREELWGDRLEAARQVTAEIAKAIAVFEPVTMLARPDLTASASLGCGPGIPVLPMPQDDSWTRDTGPTFVTAPGRLAGVAWRFNGWGEQWPDHAQDALMARRVLEHLGVPRYDAPIVLEGGAIHVDGEGTCLVCAPSVLDPKRNPGLDRAAIEKVLGDHLGVAKVIWLPHGLVDDETGGHVDNVACFAAPGRVLALVREEAGDPDQEGLAANLAVLREAVDAKGRRLEVVPIAAPRPRPRDRERRLTLSYVNLYVTNGGVVMPAFHDPADRAALRAVQAAFPDREVVQIEASDLVWGGGGIHCITQQEPDPGPGPG